MGSTTWNGGSGGWGTIANWTGGIPDSTAANAEIEAYGSYSVTLEAGDAYTVNDLGMYDPDGLTLNVLGTLNLAGAGAELYDDYGTVALGGLIAGGIVEITSSEALVDDGGSLTGTLLEDLNSNIDLNGQYLQVSSGAIRGGVFGGGTLALTGSVAVGGLYLDSGTEVLVTGTALDDAFNTRLDADGGTAASILSIASTGTYAADNPNGQIDNNGGSGTIINAGLFENVDTTASYFNIYNDFTNTAGGILEAVSLVANGDPNFSLYGAENFLGGTIAGAGQILLAEGITTLAADAIADSGLFAVGYNSATLVLAGNRDFATPFNINGNGTVALSGTTLALTDTGYLNGGIFGPGLLDVSGTFNVGGLQLGSGITEILSGTEIQTSETRMDADGGMAEPTVLSITGSGIYDLVSDTQIDNYYAYEGYGTVINAGLFEKTGYDGDSNIFGDFTNTGAGDVFIAADNEISLYGLTNDLAGTISGPGELYLGDNGGIDLVTLAAGLVLEPGALVLADENTQLLLESDRTIAGAFTDEYGATFNLQGHTLTLPGTAGLDSYIQGPGAVIVTGNGDVSGLQLTGGVALEDAGTLTQDWYFNLGENSGDTATLNIGAGDVYDILNDSSIYENGANASIVNAGLFEKTADDGSSYIEAPFINTGTLAVTHGELALQSGGTLAGTLTGAGELDLGGGNFTLAANATVNTGEFNIDGGALTLSGDTTLSTLFELTGGALDLNGYHLTLGNPGDYFAGAYVYGPSTISESGRADLTGMNIGGGVILDDLGTLTQDGNINLGFSNSDTVTLNIAASANYALLNDSQIGTNGAASTINNAGLFEKLADNGASYLFAEFNNFAGATLYVAHGDVALEGGGTLAGTLIGQAIVFGGGATTLAAGAMVGIAGLYIQGGELDLASSRDFTQFFSETSGTLNLAGNNLTLTAAGDVLQNAYLTGPGTLSVQSAALYDYFVNDGAELLDTGTIAQTGANLNLGGFSGDTATLRIAAGAVYDFTNDSGIYDNAGGQGTIFNAGLIEKSADNGQSGSDAELINTGTLDVLYGSMDFSGGGQLGGTLTGAGQLELSGGVFSLTAVTDLSVANLFVDGGELALANSRAYAGEFSLGAGTLALGGNNFTLPGIANFGGAWVDGPGTLAVEGVGNLSNFSLSYGATLLDAGTITQWYGFNLGDFSGDTAALSITSQGVYDIVDDSYIQGNGAAAALQNAGLFEKTADNGFSGVQGVVLFNTGTIDAAHGVLGFNAGGTLAGTLAGAGEIELYGGTFTLTAAASLSVANLYLNGGALALENSRVYAGDFTQGDGTIALDGDTLTLANAAALGGGDAAGPGTLALIGQATLNDYGIEDGAVLLGAASITQDGGVSIGDASGDAAALQIAAGQVYQVIDDADISGQDYGGTGAASIGNAGLLQVTTDGGASAFDNINLSQDSSGTLAVARGLLDLYDASDNIAGTLAGAGEIEFQYADVTLAAGAAIDVASLEFYGGETTLGGDFSLANSLELNGGTLALAGHGITLGGNANLDNIALDGPGTVLVTGQGDLNGAALADGAVLLDAGTLTQDGDVQQGAGDADTTELSIASCAVFDVLTDNNINAEGTAAIFNAGLFEKTGAGTQESYIEGGFTNAGTIALTAGRLEFRGLSNAGWITLANGQLQTDSLLSAGPGQEGGIQLGGDATLYEVSGIDASQAITLSGTGNTIIIGNASSFGAAIGGFAQGDVIDLADMLANGYAYANGVLTLTENGGFVTSLALAGIAPAGAVGVLTENAGFVSNVALSGTTSPDAFSLISDGRGGTDIELGNPGSITIPTGEIAQDTWIAASGDFNTPGNWTNGAPGPLDDAVFEDNLRTLTITDSQSSTIAALNLEDDSAPAFDQTAGTLTLTDGGDWQGDFVQSAGAALLDESGQMGFAAGSFAGIFAGAGDFQLGDDNGVATLAPSAVITAAGFGIGADGTLVLENNLALAGAFNDSGDAELDLKGYDITLTGAADFDGGEVANAGTLTLAGGAFVTNNGNQPLAVQGAVIDVTGALADIGGFAIGSEYSLTDTASVNIAAGGTLDLAADQNIWEYGATVALTNAGLLEKTGDGGTSYVYDGGFTQAAGGTIEVASGALDFYQGSDTIAGTLAGAGEVVFQYDSVTLAAAAALDSGALEFYGGNVTLSGNEAYAGALDLTDGGTLVLSGQTLTSPDAAALGPFHLQGPGTVVAAAGGIDGLEVEGGATLVDAGTLTQVSGLSLGDAATDSSALAIGAGDAYEILDNSQIYGQDGGGAGGAEIFNAGLFEKTGDDGDSGLDEINFTQGVTGTIEAASGLLDFYDENDSIAGTLAGAGEIQFEYDNVTLAAGTALQAASLGLYDSDTTLNSNMGFAGALGLGGGGTLALNGNNLSLTGAVSLGGQNISGPGAVTASGAGDIDGLALEGGAVLADTGALTQDGGFDIAGAGTVASAFLIGPGETYDLLNDNGIYGNDSNGGEGSLVNAGLFEKTGGALTSYIQDLAVTQASAGTLAATQGELDFYTDNAAIAGTLTGAGEIAFEYSNVSFAAATALQVATLDFYGSNISLSADLSYAGAFDLAGGNTLALGGFNLSLTGAASLGGEDVSGPGTITVSSLSDIAGLNLEYGAALADFSTITEDNGFQLGDSATDSDTLAIAAGAVFNLLDDNGIGSALNEVDSSWINSGTIANAGLFEKTADAGGSQINAAFDNAATGTLDVALGVLYLDGGGTLGGIIDGAGELCIQSYYGLALTLAPGAALSVAELGINGTLALAGGFAYAGGFTDSGLLQLNGYNLTLAGAAALDADVQGAGTLSMTQAGDINGLYLYQNAVLADTGAITQDGGFTMGDAGNDSTAFSIASGAAYDLLTDNDINAYGTASIVNAGLFEKDGDYGGSTIYPVFTNTSTGTILSARGFLYFGNGGSFAGTLTGGADGTIAQGGIFEAGGTMALAAGAVVSAAEFGVTGGTLALGGNLDVAGYFDATGGAIALGGATLTIADGALGNVDLDGPGTLNVTGNAEIDGFEPVSGAVLIDHGTLAQNGGFQLGDMGADTAALSIASGAVYDLLNDYGIGAYGAVAIVNDGLFEKTADHGYSGIESGFTNAADGTIVAADGVLGFNGGGVLGGALTGAGDIQLSSGADTLTSTVVTVAELEISGNSPTLANNLTYGGYFNLDYGDSLRLDDHTLSLTGAADLVGGFNDPGTVVVAGSATVNLLDLYGGTELIVTGSINQIDQLRFGLNDPYNGPANLLSIAAGGTYNIQDDSPFEEWTANATATNAGLLEKTGDTGTSQIQPNFTQTSTGTLDVASGVVQFSGPNDALAGQVMGAGALEIQDANATLAPGLALDESALALVNSNLTLTADQSYGGAFSLAGGVIDLNGETLTLNGTAGLGELGAGYGNGYVMGPGALVVTGAGDVNGLIADNGAQIYDDGTLIQDGAFMLGDSSGDSAALGIGAGAVFNIVNGNTLGAAGAVSIDNAGLLENGVSVGVTALSESFTQSSTGTLAFTTGDLQFDGPNNVLGGTIIGAAEIDFESGTHVTLEANLGLDAASVDFNGGQVTLGAAQFYAGLLNAAGVVTALNGGNLTLAGTASLDDDTLSGPGTLVITGTAYLNGLVLENGAQLLDLGTIFQAGDVTLGQAGTQGSALVIAAGGTYGLMDGDAITPDGEASIVNAGLLAQGFGASEVAANFTQTGSGTLLASGGTLQLDGLNNSLAGSLAGNGELDLLSGSNTTLGPDLELGIAILALSGNAGLSGTLRGGGTLLLGATGALLGAGTLAVMAEDNGLIEASGGTLTVDSTITGTGSLLIAPGSELILGPGSEIGPGITFGGAGSVLGLDSAAPLPGAPIALGANETLDLIGGLATAAAISDGTLTVTLATGGIDAFTLLDASLHEQAALAPDGAGGSEIIITQTTLATVNLATASSLPGVIDLGEGHVGGALATFVTLANLAAPGPDSEGLDARFSGTTGALAASGAITTLAAGATAGGALELRLSFGTAGLALGATTLDLASDGAGIDTNPPTALAPEPITVTGTAFALAAPELASTIINFGILHVGETAQADLSLTNPLAGADEEALDASFAGTAGGAFAAGSVALLGAGSTDASSLIVGLSTGTAGVISGTAILALTSDGAGLDTLGRTGLASQTIQLIGTVHDYATLALQSLGGAGSLTSDGAHRYLLDLGTLQQGSGALAANLGVLNAAPGLADLLSGGFAISDPDGGFTNTGFSDFSGLGAGQTDAAPGITLSGADAGAYHEVITLSSTADDAALPAATIDVTGTVINPAAPAFTVPGGGAMLDGGTLSLPAIQGSVFDFVLTTVGEGTVNAGGYTFWPSETVEFGVTNSATGPAAFLAGSFSVTGDAGFTNTGFDGFSGLAPGGNLTGLEVTLGPNAPGDYAETITLYPQSGEPGDDLPLAPEQLVIEGESALCFCAGTEISTPGGPVAVERLRIGDLVQTLHRGAQPIKWIGRRSYDGRFIAGRHLMLPVCIRAGALAPGMPVRDLWVSPGHAILVAGALVPAWRLLNGESVVQAERVERVAYFHLELAGHEIIFAEQAPAESYFNETGRLHFQNGAEFARLYGEVADGAGLHRTERGFGLEALRRHRAVPAEIGGLRGYIDAAGPDRLSGWAQHMKAPEVPVCLDVLRGGRRVARVLANLYRADLRAAGLGSGCHAFELAVSAGETGALEVRRATDQAALPRTEDASRQQAAAFLRF